MLQQVLQYSLLGYEANNTKNTLQLHFRTKSVLAANKEIIRGLAQHYMPGCVLKVGAGGALTIQSRKSGRGPRPQKTDRSSGVPDGLFEVTALEAPAGDGLDALRLALADVPGFEE